LLVHHLTLYINIGHHGPDSFKDISGILIQSNDINIFLTEDVRGCSYGKQESNNSHTLQDKIDNTAVTDTKESALYATGLTEESEA